MVSMDYHGRHGDFIGDVLTQHLFEITIAATGGAVD